eukprot:Nk52_evm54s152 gene=Nk52_evmTU54s152
MVANRLFVVTLFLGLICIFAGHAKADGEHYKKNVRSIMKSIYGKDDREEVCDAVGELPDGSSFKIGARASVLITMKTNLSPAAANGKSVLKLTTQPKMCEDDASLQNAHDNNAILKTYAKDPVGGHCSGFLVGDAASNDIVVTAGHCIEGPIDCESVAFIFDWEKDCTKKNSYEGLENMEIENSKIRYCSELIKAKYDLGKMDFSIVRMNSPIDRRGSAIDFSAFHKHSLKMYGHPLGLQKKASAGDVKLNLPSSTIIKASLDAFKGNSGSLVVDSTTGRTAGILVSGQADFVVQAINGNADDKCYKLATCHEDGCNLSSGKGFEDVFKLSAFKAHMPKTLAMCDGCEIGIVQTKPTGPMSYTFIRDLFPKSFPQFTIENTAKSTFVVTFEISHIYNSVQLISKCNEDDAPEKCSESGWNKNNVGHRIAVTMAPKEIQIIGILPSGKSWQPKEDVILTMNTTNTETREFSQTRLYYKHDPVVFLESGKTSYPVDFNGNAERIKLHKCAMDTAKETLKEHKGTSIFAFTSKTGGKISLNTCSATSTYDTILSIFPIEEDSYQIDFAKGKCNRNILSSVLAQRPDCKSGQSSIADYQLSAGKSYIIVITTMRYTGAKAVLNIDGSTDFVKNVPVDIYKYLGIQDTPGQEWSTFTDSSSTSGSALTIQGHVYEYTLVFNNVKISAISTVWQRKIVEAFDASAETVKSATRRRSTSSSTMKSLIQDGDNAKMIITSSKSVLPEAVKKDMNSKNQFKVSSLSVSEGASVGTTSGGGESGNASDASESSSEDDKVSQTDQSTKPKDSGNGASLLFPSILVSYLSILSSAFL